MKSQLAFIAGASRSGTTWLRRSLASHPDVVSMPETQLFKCAGMSPAEGHRAVIEGGALWRRLSLLQGKPLPLDDRGQCTEPLTVPVSPARIEGLFDLMRDMPAKESFDHVAAEFFHLLDGVRPWILEKSPIHVFQLDSIFRNFPSARVLLTLRDGRDVLCSARDLWKDRFPGICRLESAAHRWVRICQTIAAAARRWPTQVLVVRYEELLTRYESVLEEALSFLDLPFDAARIEEIRRANTFQAYSGRPNGSEHRGSFYRRGLAGGYHQDLSDEELLAYERIAGPTLRGLGYPLHGMAGQETAKTWSLAAGDFGCMSEAADREPVRPVPLTRR